ncbi:guanine nucleotide exchange factor subunit RIC1-like [Sycon ciliatum]|uniref:guanine nucleotide exchange factor subunit RIC1-like n=1 Tax=Sycon ciliatum TaxID=27933 RepID=UPI0031F664CE
MYFSVGWPDVFKPQDSDGGDLILVRANDSQSLFAVLSARSLYIWSSKPRVLSSVYSRCEKSISDHGTNADLVWAASGDRLVVSTSSGRLLFFHVENDTSETAFPNEAHHGIVSSVTLTHTNVVPVAGEITCLHRIDGPCVVTKTHILRYKWNGSLMYALTMPPLVNPDAAAATPSSENVEKYVVHLEFQPLMRGIGLVFNTGEAAFWLNPAKNHTALAWAPGVEAANRVALNGKFRLMAVGTRSGKCFVFTLEDELNKLMLSHTLFLASTDYPNLHLGAVKCLQWSPDGYALAMSWHGFGLAVWSCFGSLLYASVTNDHKLLPSWPMHCQLEIYSLAWLATGFQLMFLANSLHPDAPQTQGSIFTMKFVKSALTSNPCFSNQKHLVLYGDNQVLLQPGESILRSRVMPPMPSTRPESSTSRTSLTSFDDDLRRSVDLPIPINLVIGPTSKQVSVSSVQDGVRGSDFAHQQQQSTQQPWITLQVPEKYIQANWPLRYVAVSDSARYVAVAGQYGIAHCNVATQRWKVFGNVSQETNITVCGGLAWWKDMIVVPCHNYNDDSDEIRFYPQSSNLDNSNVALTLRVPCVIHLINLLSNCLSVVTRDKKLHLFGLRLDKNGPSGSGMIVLHSMPELSLAQFVPSIVHLIALFPTEMSMEASSADSDNSANPKAEGTLPKSLVANVSGRVLVLSRDLASAPSSQPSTSQSASTVPYCRPVALASSVEMIWSAAHSTSCRYLQQALWLGCGASGMKVWLPLFPTSDDPQPSFLSKRIMLTFPLRIYPLAICFEDAVVIGVAQSFKEIVVNSDCSSSSQLFPFATTERTVQIYLHHILRSLLRRNTVVHCEEIAQSCSSLPYFAHVLELMLHEVLEEEAVKRPQDALLPAIIAFLKLFPQYLEVVGRCARKTEVALWRHLFQYVGSPEELFAECLAHNQLEMAASYLIIIQSIEAPKVSRQHATRLLNSSLEQRLWPLAKDLVRFLRTIAASSEPATPTASVPPVSIATSPVTAERRPLGRMSSADSTGKDEPEMNFVRPVFTTGDIQSSREEYFIDVILARHARKMLAEGNLRDLGSFVAYLDFPLKSWLTKERYRVGKVENFMACFQMIHTDFEWPLPNTPVEFSAVRRSAADVQLLSPRLSCGSTSSTTASDSANAASASAAAASMSPPDQFKTNPPWSSLVALSSALRDNISIKSASSLDALSDFGGDDDTMDESVLAEMNESRKGSHQSEQELRYMMTVMLSAGCFDWAILIAVVLRDSSRVNTVLHVARDVATSLTEFSERKEAASMAERILVGLDLLCKWAQDRCEFFLPFLNSVTDQWSSIVQAQVDVMENQTTPTQDGCVFAIPSSSSTDGAPADGTAPGSDEAATARRDSSTLRTPSSGSRGSASSDGGGCVIS